MISNETSQLVHIVQSYTYSSRRCWIHSQNMLDKYLSKNVALSINIPKKKSHELKTERGLVCSAIAHPLHFHVLFTAALTRFNWYGNRSGKTWQEQAWLFRPFITVYCPSTNYRQSTALQPPTNLLPHDLTELQAAAERQLWVDKYNL